MKATVLLRDQHRRVERLLARVGRERQLRLPLVLQIVEELMTHLSIEDHVFLCRFADATGVRAERYREDQARVRNAMLQAVFAEEHDDKFADRLRDLAHAFDQHSRALERDVFPLAESQMSADDLDAIGNRMQSFWNASVTPHDVPPARSHEHAAE
jgi:hypothetical protein